MSKPIASLTLMLLCLVCELARFGYVGQGQTFAADLTTIKPGGRSKEPLGRVYVSHGKVRIETRDLADGFFIVDGTKPAAWFLRPRQRLFMDAKRSSPLTQIFVRVDPNDACRQWQGMERIAGGAPENEWRCEQLGADAIDNSEALKYQVVSRGKAGFRWVDPLRRFPVRVEHADGTVVIVEPIVDEAQAATLFAVPEGYQKFDPLQLIERIKQSDVWVEPRR